MVTMLEMFPSVSESNVSERNVNDVAYVEVVDHQIGPDQLSFLELWTSKLRDEVG